MIPYIQFNNLEHNIGTRRVLNIPDFTIYKGDFLGVMGPNGAGKSTFLKVASFLEAPAAGSISYQGESITKGQAPLHLKRKFSVALQQSLLLDMSVFQNIIVGLKIRGCPKKEMKEKASHWMERFQISHLAKKNANQLSGGEAQRVNLARAMILEPEVLFLDEPFSALDFPTKINLMEDFKQILESTDATAVFISHDLMEIKFLTNRLAIMIDGEFRQSGRTMEVLDAPNPEAAPFLEIWKKHSY